MNEMPRSFWTAEEDATLARLVEAGNSAGMIAKQLGRARSAICGRARRKGLHFKGQKLVPCERRQRFTAGEDKIIREMASEGKSGFDIGQVLNRHKSSIVQRARKLGAPLKGKDGPKPKAVHPGNIANKRTSRANDPGFNHVTPALPMVVPRMVKLVDLESDHCRFPIGDPKDEGFGFCGHPKVEGCYCWHHAALCYTPPELRRRLAA